MLDARCGGGETTNTFFETYSFSNEWQDTKFSIVLTPPTQCAHKVAPFLGEYYKTARLATYRATFSGLALGSLLFHLMLKQMMPQLPAPNYINCEARRRSLVNGSLEELRALGLVSVAYNQFVGMAPEQPPAYTFIRECSLGYLFMPGMQTLGDCGKYMSWLQFLTIARFDLLEKQQRSFKSMLLGPQQE